MSLDDTECTRPTNGTLPCLSKKSKLTTYPDARFPYQLGYDAAGVVTEVGEGVKGLGVGDEVYTRLPEASRGKTEFCCAPCCGDDDESGEKNQKLILSTGSWSEYVKCSERYVALKPKNLSFSDAASLPLAAVTALQVLRQHKGSLEGKTVFIPAGRKSPRTSHARTEH